MAGLTPVEIINLSYGNLTVSPVLTFLAVIVFSYVLIYKSTLLRADQKGYIIDKVSIIINVIRTITQIISVVVFKN